MSRSSRLVAAVIVLGSLGGLGVLFADRVDASLTAKQQAAQPVEIEAPRVRTEPLGRHATEAQVRFTGTLRAVRRVDVVPEIAGRIEKLDVAVGDRVKADWWLPGPAAVREWLGQLASSVSA